MYNISNIVNIIKDWLKFFVIFFISSLVFYVSFYLTQSDLYITNIKASFCLSICIFGMGYFLFLFIGILSLLFLKENNVFNYPIVPVLIISLFSIIMPFVVQNTDILSGSNIDQPKPVIEKKVKVRKEKIKPSSYIKNKFPDLYKSKNEITQRISIISEKQIEAFRKLEKINDPNAKEIIKEEIITYTFIKSIFTKKLQDLKEAYDILFAIHKTESDSKILEAELKKVSSVTSLISEECKRIQNDIKTVNGTNNL